MSILFELLYNFSILVSISIISGFIGHRGNKGWNSALSQGLLFGSASVIGMLHPFVVAPGLIFDGRSVMISLTGLFFGPVAATIAGMMALVLRIQQGGDGAIMGVLAIISSALWGILFWTRSKQNDGEVTKRQLLYMGIIVHVTMILLMFTLPTDKGISTIKLIGLPILIIYPLATVFIGRIISESNERRHIAEALRESQQNLTSTNQELKAYISERNKMEQQLEYLSYHDQLTGLYNRRFFEEQLKRLDVKRNLPLSIVMADVNGLKLINDSFGHAVGDELLKKVAEVITKGCRADEIIARLGGDEFVILLPKTNVDETEQIFKRVTDLVLKEKIGSIDISVSFGWETKNNEEERIQDIFKKAEDHMYKKKLLESPSMRGKTIKSIINDLYEKNKQEEQHAQRVSVLCESLGKVLCLCEGGIEELKTVGLLHDIGKIAIKESILNKPGRLTEAEWEEIRRHPEIGYRILSTVNDMSEIAEYVLSHHEKWDGSGYPKGLKGEEIPLQSRIIAVADSYDAMTSERSYRSALPKAMAIEELQKNAGLQFDPELVRVFIEKVSGKTIG